MRGLYGAAQLQFGGQDRLVCIALPHSGRLQHISVGLPPPLSPADLSFPLFASISRANAPEIGCKAPPHIESGRSRKAAKPVMDVTPGRPRWMACWERLEASTPGVHLVRDTHADVMPYSLAADALVSDASVFRPGGSGSEGGSSRRNSGSSCG